MMNKSSSVPDERSSGVTRREVSCSIALTGGLITAVTLSPLGGQRAWAAGSAALTAPTHWPNLLLRSLQGQTITLPARPWRATLVDFWASWCTPCRLSFPWMNRLHEQWAGKGLRIVAVNLDRRKDDALRFLAAHPPQFEIVMDPAAESANALQIQAMPTSLLLAADGSIRWMHRGFRESDIPALERNIEGALT